MLIERKLMQKLGVSWFLDLPEDVGLVSTPLVIDGVLYFTGTMNVVRAVDARSGKLLWTHDPEVGRACPDGVRCSVRRTPVL